MVLYGGYKVLEKMDDEAQSTMYQYSASQVDRNQVMPTMPMRNVNRMPTAQHSASTGPYLKKPIVNSSRTLFNHQVSSAVTHTYGGSAYGGLSTTGNTGITTTSHSAKTGTSSVTMPVVYAPNAPLAAVKPIRQESQVTVRKAPGTGGVRTQWETWLDEWEAAGHDRNDPTGLEEWWYENYGDGANPNIFDDFYSYYFSTPVGDGVWVMMLLVISYVLLKSIKINLRTALKVESEL